VHSKLHQSKGVVAAALSVTTRFSDGTVSAELDASARPPNIGLSYDSSPDNNFLLLEDTVCIP